MRSAVLDILPPKLRRTLKKFGADLSIARRKRQLTISMMCERLGVSKATYQRVEEGEKFSSVRQRALDDKRRDRAVRYSLRAQ